MKNYSLVVVAALLLFGSSVSAQDTFSIVAVDSITGEVGSAGASCLDNSDIIGGVLIISDILPGKGAIHTQSYWHPTNQQNARLRMEAGDSPTEVIAWLEANDAQNNPLIRQYGIADFDSADHPRTAAFTGDSCFDYKNHILGPNYAIQGNILLGQQILDSMEARFLATDGPLALKLMAALQGANVPGADTRCEDEGVSSQSAFVRVAKMDDDPNDLYCDLLVAETPVGVEPIDELQTLFDAWYGEVLGLPEPARQSIVAYPNPTRNSTVVRIEHFQKPLQYELLNQLGQVELSGRLDSASTEINTSSLSAGIYFLRAQPLRFGYPIVERIVVH